MSSLISLEPRTENFDIYLRDINNGIIQIPEFQRDFIWDLENVLNLLRSIKKNYPIGSFLFWKPNTTFKVARQIGPYFIKEELVNDFETITCKYVLDGYQRMSSLFGTLMNPINVSNFNLDTDLYNSTFRIYYNLRDEEFENYKNSGYLLESCVVPVYVLLDYEGFLTVSQEILNDYDLEESQLYTNRLKKIVTIFDRYRMPVIEIAGGTLEEAIDIFTLLNKEGKPITPDWILSAKTYSSNFRLGDKIDEVLNRLEYYNFSDRNPKETAVRELIFRSIQSSFGDLYLDTKKTDIIALSKKNNFQEQVEKTIRSIERAVKFMFEELLIVDNKLLPASMQFIFLVEFFNYNEDLSSYQIDELKNWFWITSYVNYFTIYSPSKRKEAFLFFQRYSKGVNSQSVYVDIPKGYYMVPELSKKVNFGSVRSKAHMLFMLNYSINFSKVKVDSVKGFKVVKLFSNLDKELLDRFGESSNMIIYLDSYYTIFKEDNITRPKDYSFTLENRYRGQLENIFITDEMRDLYFEGKIEDVLRLRKFLIEDKEREHVERLGFNIKYDDYFDVPF